MEYQTINHERIAHIHGFVCVQSSRSIHPRVIVSNRSAINVGDVILGVKKVVGHSYGHEDFSFENLSNDEIEDYLLQREFQVQVNKLSGLVIVIFIIKSKCIYFFY